MDGLKARLSFDAVAYDYDDEYLTIDTDTHTININNVSRLFGVQYDGNSKLIKFRIRNKLSDIQKMQDSIVYINWIDSKGVKGQSIAINKTINNDTCEFAWKVPFDALKNSGVLHFAMSAVMTKNSSSVIDQRWSTQIASVITPDGIYIKSYTPSSEEEDRIAQIYNELSNIINKQSDILNNLQSQVNSLNEDLVEQGNNLGLEKITGISLKSWYQEDFNKTSMNNDYIYTSGDFSQITKNTKKVIMDVYSNGGTGTIFITDPQWITRFVETYTFVKGINHLEIDVSQIAPKYDFLKINFYSDTTGAFTTQNMSDTLMPYSSVFTFYSKFDSKILNTYMTLEPYPTYWDGNVNGLKSSPCIDIYFEEELEQRKTGLIIVAKDGTGDYTTINDAVRNAGDINNPTTILLREGVYDEVVYLRNKHNISIVGINRDKCIIQNTTGQYGNTPVMINGDFELRNLTIKMFEKGFYPTYEDNVFTTYPGYALHIDGNSKNKNKQTIGKITNCTLYSEAFPAVGMGVNENQKVIFENCELIRNTAKDYFKKDNWKGAILCHSSNYENAPNQKLIMKDCVIHSNYGKSGQIRGNLGDSKSFEITMINNTCYSDTDGINSFEYEKGESTLNTMSHGNTSLNLNALVNETNKIRSELSFTALTNLFDKYVAINNIGQYNNEGYYDASIIDWRYCKFPVKPKTKYTINKFSHIVFYKDDTYLSGTYNASTTETKTVITPDACNYCIVSVNVAEVATTVFCEGGHIVDNPTYENTVNIKNLYHEIETKLPTVKKEKVICGKVNDGLTAYYAGVDCGGIPNLINIGFVFEIGNKSGTVALICNPNGINRISNITQSSLHLTITNRHLKVDLLGEKYGNYYYHNLFDVDIKREIPLDGNTSVIVTMKIAGNDVIVDIIMNGTTDTYTATWNGDETHTLSDFIGKYVSFEHYCGGNRDEFAMPMFNFFEAKGTTFERVFDYFEREDGVLNTTPSGQTYVLLTNEDKYSGNYN